MRLKEKISRAFKLFEENKFNESVTIYKELLENNLSIDDEINVRYGYGYPLSELGLVDAAIDNYSKLKELGEKNKNLEVVSQAIHQQGMVYRQAKQYENALERFFIENDIIQKYFKNNKLFQSANHYEIGYTYFLVRNVNKAKDYLKKSLIEAKESEDSIMIACAYRGLGEYYAQYESKKKALDCFEKSIQHFELASDVQGIAEVRKLLEK